MDTSPERTLWHKVVVGIAGLSIGLAACAGDSDSPPAPVSTSNVDRAGGELVTPQILTFANGNETPGEQLTYFAEAVEEASDGTLSIEFQNLWRADEEGNEAKIITDVADGKVDLAWVGARAFELIGVTSFQALIAPLLVDSHELQAAVFEAGIPEKMLEDLDELGVVGIGTLPGPLQKMLGKTHPYITPDDYTGDVIGAELGLQSSVFEELGATPHWMRTGADVSVVDGFNQHLGSIWGNQYQFEADYVTANVNFWPRPLVLFANADVYESLDETEQAALTTVFEAGVQASWALLDSEETNSGESLCNAGMQFPTAGDDQLAGLRSEIEPIYGQLAADPETNGFLNAITAIKGDLGAPPHTVNCPQVEPGSTGTDIEGPPEGTYTMTLSPSDAPADCPLEPPVETLFTMTLANGSVEMWAQVGGAGSERELGWAGPYAAFRDRIELGTMTARWSFDGDELMFSDMEDVLSCGDVVVWATHPWVLAQD